MLKELLNKRKSQKGFTIIEVMIVLAIAGLILVVVLVAIPQLQKNQRNENRKSVLARIAAEVNNYVGNNEGDVPTNGVDPTTGFGGGFYDRYITDEGGTEFNTFLNPVGESYDYVSGAGGDPAENEIVYEQGALCEGELATGLGTARNFAIAVWLEGGASFCVDNE